MIRLTVTSASAYASAVFAAGFVLGTLRALVLAPQVGPVAAVLVELPLMIAVSLVACRWALRRWPVPARALPRAAMGALAFCLLMAAEIALGLWGFGRTLQEIATAVTRADGALGLAGQLVFATLPLFLRRRTH